MEIQTERIGSVDVVAASGRLDAIYSTAFAKQVGELLTGSQPKVLLDFSDIDFVTSAGLRAVLLLLNKATAAGGVFALCGVNDQVREVLDISGLAAMFSIHSGRAEGLTALEAIAPIAANNPPTSPAR